MPSGCLISCHSEGAKRLKNPEPYVNTGFFTAFRMTNPYIINFLDNPKVYFEIILCYIEKSMIQQYYLHFFSNENFPSSFASITIVSPEEYSFSSILIANGLDICLCSARFNGLAP